MKTNPQLNDAISDFMKKQFEMQAAQMTGQGMDPDLMQQIQQLSAILMQDPSAAQYLQCQMRFSMMMADVYKIISEVADLEGSSPIGKQQCIIMDLATIVYFGIINAVKSQKSLSVI